MGQNTQTSDTASTAYYERSWYIAHLAKCRVHGTARQVPGTWHTYQRQRKRKQQQLTDKHIHTRATANVGQRTRDHNNNEHVTTTTETAADTRCKHRPIT